MNPQLGLCKYGFVVTSIQTNGRVYMQERKTKYTYSCFDEWDLDQNINELLQQWGAE